MTELIAHILLFLRGRRPVWLGGVYWAYCSHRSHQRGTRCRRWMVYDGYCAMHNSTCYSGCEEQDDEEMKETA